MIEETENPTMIISTRGRYALRVMIDLAEKETDEYVPMKEIAQRQNLSLKYTERIMAELSKNNLVEGVHGKGGGYRLSRKPKDYTVFEILLCAKENLVPVSCLECGAEVCERAEKCKTLPMWKKFHKTAVDFFESITLEELSDGQGF